MKGEGGIGADIDWPSIVRRMQQKVDECCGCNYYAYLTDAEAAAVNAALSELTPSSAHPEDAHSDCLLCAEGRTPADHALGDS